VVIKNKLSEELNEYYFVPRKDKSLKDQILYSDENINLLNVRKIYTNNTYFGVSYTTLHNSDSSFLHEFRCKDRGFSEEIVDDKESFLHLFKTNLLDSSLNLISAYKNEFVKKPANFFTQYDLHFYYNNNNEYKCSSIMFNNCLFRGIYGSQDEEEYEINTKVFGFTTLNREPTEYEVKDHLVNKAKISFSNHITRVNTAYSDIKVFHKTEI